MSNIYNYIIKYKGYGYESPKTKHIYIPYLYNPKNCTEIYLNLNNLKTEFTVQNMLWTKLGRELFYKPKLVNPKKIIEQQKINLFS